MSQRCSALLRTLWLSVLLLVFCSGAWAGVAEQVRDDLKPVSGYIIMPVGDEYLIDLDAGDGVAAGDLFSVVKAGEKIVHPVTGEVIGSLDQVQAVLQVTRVKSGYSYAKGLGASEALERGAAIRRFENLQTVFWDYTGQGESIYNQLTSALPALDWQAYAATQARKPAAPSAAVTDGADLIFVLQGGVLELRDARGAQLRRYSVTAPATAAAPRVPAAVPAPPAALVLPKPAVTAPAAPAPAAPFQLETPRGTTGSVAGLSLEFPGARPLGTLGALSALADFIDYGGRTLMASTNGDQINLYAVGDKVRELSVADTRAVVQILSVQWWVPGTGEIYLAATTWDERRIEGRLFALKGDRLELLPARISYVLGTLDRNQDGLPESLLGQAFDQQTFWGKSIKEVSLKGDKLSASKLTFKLPRRFTVQGGMQADLSGNGQNETAFVRNGILYIFAEGKLLYKSPKQIGGTLSVAAYDTNPNNTDQPMLEYAFFEVSPVAADLDGDGLPELVVPAADRSIVGAPGLSSGVKRSWLAVFKYKDGMFLKGRLGDEMDVPLVGVQLTGDQAMFVATTPPSFMGQGGASYLLSFPLKAQ